MKVEEAVRLALEARRRVEEEDLGLKAEYARLKSEAEEKASFRIKSLRKQSLKQRSISVHG